jgi:hypothetical protein
MPGEIERLKETAYHRSPPGAQTGEIPESHPGPIQTTRMPRGMPYDTGRSSSSFVKIGEFIRDGIGGRW